MIYLLWDHGEYGPQWIVATTDRSQVRSLLDQYPLGSQSRPVVEANLDELLKKGDGELVGEGHPLERGWGVLNFQVLREGEASDVA